MYCQYRQFYSKPIWCQAVTYKKVGRFKSMFYSKPIWCQAVTMVQVLVILVKFYSKPIWCQAVTMAAETPGCEGVLLKAYLVSSCN